MHRTTIGNDADDLINYTSAAHAITAVSSRARTESHTTLPGLFFSNFLKCAGEQIPLGRPVYTAMSTTVGAYVIGTIAGTVGSLVGMGGSFVALPMLTARRMGLNMSQHTAIGTSMATVFFTSIGGCIAFASADGSPVARLLDRSQPLPTTVGNVH